MSQMNIGGWDDYENDVMDGTFTPDEDKLCGVASALMIRSKTEKNTVISKDDNSVTNNCLTDMTFWLYIGRYGGTKNYRIDVNMTGLLYVYPGWNIYPQTDYNSVLDQFNITRYIIYNFYTAEKEKLDYISIDRGFVSDISMYCEPASVALARVWNHININREPAVVVCDYNVIHKIRFPNNIQYTGVSPHYIVIAGIRENNSVREFYTLDPWNTMREHWYTEFEMEEIIHIGYQFMDTFWLWYLPIHLGLSTQKPCYVGIINES